MKSPYTGKEMRRKFEPASWHFRGEDFPYMKEFWECEDTGERFTTTEGDTAGYNQVINQYRVAHGIPFTDEIVHLRKRYGISATKMSRILGMGDNQYRYYENGEVPSESNGKLIRSAFNPKVMLEMLNCSQEIAAQPGTDKMVEKVGQLIAHSEEYKLSEYDRRRIFQVARGVGNGYAPLSLDRLKNVLLYVLGRSRHVWTTKMNKILFYIDFVAYRENGIAITGLPYRALDYGPVPERWDRVYSEFDEVCQIPAPTREGTGTVLCPDSEADISSFSPEEIQVMDQVCDALGRMSASRLSELSHAEDAWLTKHAAHARLDFADAFTLKAL